jgi:hypothetical protein
MKASAKAEKEKNDMTTKHIVVELYNQGDGFYPRVMRADVFGTKVEARKFATKLARNLLKSYNLQTTDGLGDAGIRFDDVWIKVRSKTEWGFDAVEKTINRDIRVVEAVEC